MDREALSLRTEGGQAIGAEHVHPHAEGVHPSMDDMGT